MRNVLLSFVATVLMGIATAAAATPEEAAQAAYLKAVAPEAGMAAVDAAETAFQALNGGKPTPAQRLRIAALTAARAQYVWMPWKKSDFSSSSVAQFDGLWNLVRASNDEALRFEFHFYRGSTYVHFPRFLRKFDIALDDLSQAAKIGDKLGRPDAEMCVVYLTYARALRDDDLAAEARVIATRALKLAPNDSLKSEARSLMAAE